jgi:mannose-6-phosphate isomerase-like protein (cupin superfamily)
MPMDRAEFETELRAQGYQDIAERQMPANQINPGHAHEFDARLLILEGEMTITRDGEEHTYRAGDSCAVSAGCRHAERVGREGVQYIAGRRPQSAAG